jgi:hypothetical protein
MISRAPHDKHTKQKSGGGGTLGFCTNSTEKHRARAAAGMRSSDEGRTFSFIFQKYFKKGVPRGSGHVDAITTQ